MKTLALALLATLALAAPASAKEIASVAVCGASSCVTYTGRDETALLVESDPGATPAPPGPYYVLTVKGREPGGRTFGWKAFYVPSTRAVAGVDDSTSLVHWSSPVAGGQRLLDAAAAKLEPFPAPRVESVRVDGKPVTGDPQSYLRLFAIEDSAAVPEPKRWDWVPVDLVSSGTTPWTGSDRDLMFSPSAGAIERGTVRVRLPGGVVDAVASGATIPGAGGGFPWLPAALLALAALLSAAVIAGARPGEHGLSRHFRRRRTARAA